MSSLLVPATTDIDELDNLGINTSTTADLTFKKLYAGYIISYAVGFISGIVISTMIGFCCYQRNKSRKNGNIHGTVGRRNMDQQQVQLLIHRRLPFDGTGSNSFTIRHSILNASDWDEEAKLQHFSRESQAIQQEGLLYSSESIDNIASNLRTEPMSSTQTNVVMPTTVTNYASVNFTQYSTPISKNCKKVKTEINNGCSDNPSHLKHKTSQVTNERSDNTSHLRHKTSEVTNECSDNPSHLRHKTSEVTNECSDNPSHLKHKTGEVTNERSDNPSHLRHKTSEVTNECSDNPSHLKHKTGEVTNERSDNPSHLRHKTGEVTNQRSDSPSHLRHKTGEVTNQRSDNPSHLKHNTGEVTNQPSTNNEKSQTAVNQEELENVTLISVSVSERKHDTKVNKMLNSYHKANKLEKFNRSAYERMNRAKTLNKCLQIEFEDDSKCCRSHSFVEFVPNSPDHIKIDGKIWHTKSNE